MSVPVVILGRSGSGKSASLRNINPNKVLLIQTITKPLPFKSQEWKPFDRKTKEGSILVSDQAEHMIAAIKKAHEFDREIVIIDDFQYQMSNEFMRRGMERGYDKFIEIGKNAWDIIGAINEAASNVRVYILSHIQEDEGGMNQRMKTIGKMLDEKIVLEGMFTIVLKSLYHDGQYIFTTKTTGQDTVKTPMGLFDKPVIENDLNAVDEAICEYYNIGE